MDKECIHCKEFKSLEEFRIVRAKGRVSRQGMCRVCANKMQKNRRDNDPEARAYHFADLLNYKHATSERLDRHHLATLIKGATECFYCRLPNEGGLQLGLDHRVALSDGGKHEYSNLVACCTGCNRAKFGRTEAQHREWLAGVAKRLQPVIEPTSSKEW